MDVHLHGVSCFLDVEHGVDEKVSRCRLHKVVVADRDVQRIAHPRIVGANAAHRDRRLLLPLGRLQRFVRPRHFDRTDFRHPIGQTPARRQLEPQKTVRHDVAGERQANGGGGFAGVLRGGEGCVDQRAPRLHRAGVLRAPRRLDQLRSDVRLTG